MKKSRFTETQIISILSQHEQGRKVADLAREYGISAATFYNWKAKYGGRAQPVGDITNRLKPTKLAKQHRH
jgi:putative transposase